MAIYVNLNRDTSKDIQLGNPTTVYTDSTTLATGMTLYDNTGTDTGLMIGAINQDGTFEIGTYEITFVLDEAFVSNIILDEVTYTDDFTIKLSEGTHSLTVNGDYVSAFIESNQGTSTTVANGVSTLNPYSGSLNISSNGSIKETSNDYTFGTCPITLTFTGSANATGGGSN